MKKGLRQETGRESRREEEGIGYAESKQKDEEEERETICNRYYDKMVQRGAKRKYNRKTSRVTQGVKWIGREYSMPVFRHY